ncbi:hypothetical protein Glove_236g33 [Diversispora epigaea]|uniref:Protein kinase domain-containing protein n=1 Tax=Diversispora epigaea TaxID=1348612 RepID=A0A397IB37_9GLOM|nr:hypothetical protein Glove_236g33 [Diversispora epigaea]
MEQSTTTNNLNKISISDKLVHEKIHKVDYGKYGMCKECGNKNTYYNWCSQCNSQRLQLNFENWTSGNKVVDAIIQESQSNCTTCYFIEWIPYSKFKDIKYIAKGGFGKIYSVLEGRIY